MKCGKFIPHLWSFLGHFAENVIRTNADTLSLFIRRRGWDHRQLGVKQARIYLMTKTSSTGIEHVIELLRLFAAPNVFNPWRDQDTFDALPEAATRRVERLLAHFDCRPAMLLIGEAPGYQGCHFSGVAFTNENLIMAGSIPRVSSAFRITSREKPWCEPSATIVWRTLREFGLADRVVLWNAFAWHPHDPADRLSNRTPTPQELKSGLFALEAVLNHFAGVPIVPVGQVAGRTLAQLGISAFPAVRHPSRGGATEFRAGIQKLLANTRL